MNNNTLLSDLVIKKAYRILYIMLDGAKHSHTNVVEIAQKVVEKNIGLDSTLPEYLELINIVVSMFESEVGLKTFDPDVIVANPNSDLWLYKKKDIVNHGYFSRYRYYLEQDGFASKAIDNIELSCEKTLSHCVDPKNIRDESNRKKRGLVVGDVQSGKTANYLGLINMACDYGYKIIVLLAGMTDSLRIQTQKRIDTGFIGALSTSIGNTIAYCGVGLSNNEHYAIPLTNTEQDFAKFVQKNLNASASDFSKPIVIVVKKNKKILESVETWLQPGKNKIHCKNILIIDDEADNASISTAKPGKNPTTINRCIRGIYNNFPIASYVGYTATPFANIFINPDDADMGNLDLFPSDFIVQLKAPDSYFGDLKVFPPDQGNPRSLRIISEDENFFLPVIHKKDDHFFGLSDSLKEAFYSFIINNVVRTHRGQKRKHRSMMINISKFNDMQSAIATHVESYKDKLLQIVEQDSYKPVEEFIKNEDMHAIYTLFTQSDFYELIRNGDESKNIEPIKWEDIQAGMYDELKQFIVIIVNNRNTKNNRLDYDKYSENGGRVIAVGGYVLSRGLTLEGLMVSFYSRNAAAYDTLLQMCRWFGYRPKYEDLCRVYISQVNIDSFKSVLDAVNDLKTQFSEMARNHKKPRDFGLMIKESPDTLETTLLVTSRNKMRETEDLVCHLNYGGVYSDTSKLLKNPSINNHNHKVFNVFYKKYEDSFVNGKRYTATNVDQKDIAELIKNLKIPCENKKFDVDGLSEYIANSDIFPFWDVVIATGDSSDKKFLQNGALSAVKRSFHLGKNEESFIRIGGSNNRILDPGIFNTGLNILEKQKREILRKKDEISPEAAPHKDLTAKDYLKIREIPILVVYPIDLSEDKLDGESQETAFEKVKIKNAYKDAGNELLLGFAIGFPEKESKVIVKYRANKIKLEQLTKNMDVDEDDEDGETDD